MHSVASSTELFPELQLYSETSGSDLGFAIYYLYDLGQVI